MGNQWRDQQYLTARRVLEEFRSRPLCSQEAKYLDACLKLMFVDLRIQRWAENQITKNAGDKKLKEFVTRLVKTFDCANELSESNYAQLLTITLDSGEEISLSEFIRALFSPVIKGKEGNPFYFLSEFARKAGDERLMEQSVDECVDGVLLLAFGSNARKHVRPGKGSRAHNLLSNILAVFEPEKDYSRQISKYLTAYLAAAALPTEKHKS